jgi:hypothetical protein
VTSDYDPGSDPGVQAAYDAYAAAAAEHNAYLFASGEALFPWEKAQVLAEGGTLAADPAHRSEHRLYQADKAYYRAWHAANKRARPELYRDGVGPGFRHPDQWRQLYPHAACEPTPYEYGLTGDPAASWGDFYIAEDGTVTRFILADAAAQAGTEPEPEAGS